MEGGAYPGEKVLFLNGEPLAHAFSTGYKLKSDDSEAEDIRLRRKLTVTSIFWRHIASTFSKNTFPLE